MKKERVLLFESGDESADLEAYEVLRSNPAFGVAVVPQGQLLRDLLVLPFVETSEGERHFGLDGIQSFVAKTIQNAH